MIYRPSSGRLLLYGSILLTITSRAAWPAIAPSISVQTSTAVAGGTAVVPILFSTGSANVVGLQIDLLLPTAITPVSVSEGAAALAAGKSAIGNPIAAGV